MYISSVSWIDLNLAGTVQPLACDGLNMGHPCCSHFRCTEPLQKTSHHFCASHRHLNEMCAIIGCLNKSAEKRKTCLDHHPIEDKHKEHGKAIWQLHHRYQAALRTTDSNPEEDHTMGGGEDVEPLLEGEEWFEIAGNNVRIFSDPVPGFTGIADSVSTY